TDLRPVATAGVFLRAAAREVCPGGIGNRVSVSVLDRGASAPTRSLPQPAAAMRVFEGLCRSARPPSAELRRSPAGRSYSLAVAGGSKNASACARSSVGPPRPHRPGDPGRPEGKRHTGRPLQPKGGGGGNVREVAAGGHEEVPEIDQPVHPSRV